jgi:hypothetical protein
MGFLVQKDGAIMAPTRTYLFTIGNVDQYYCTSMLYFVPPMRCTNMFIQMPLDMNLFQWNHTLHDLYAVWLPFLPSSLYEDCNYNSFMEGMKK